LRFWVQSQELLALQKQSMIAAHTAKETQEVKRINAEIMEREREEQVRRLLNEPRLVLNLLLTESRLCYVALRAGEEAR
jgi:hypothetical protein